MSRTGKRGDTARRHASKVEGHAEHEAVETAERAKGEADEIKREAHV